MAGIKTRAYTAATFGGERRPRPKRRRIGRDKLLARIRSLEAQQREARKQAARRKSRIVAWRQPLPVRKTKAKKRNASFNRRNPKKRRSQSRPIAPVQALMPNIGPASTLQKETRAQPELVLASRQSEQDFRFIELCAPSLAAITMRTILTEFTNEFELRAEYRRYQDIAFLIRCRSQHWTQKQVLARARSYMGPMGRTLKARDVSLGEAESISRQHQRLR